MPTATLRRAALRAATSSLSVDDAAGAICGAALMTIGPAQGHGFNCDATTLAQLCELVNATGDDGVRCRFTHPPIETTPGGGQSIADDLGTVVGTVKNARIDGNVARGDIFLGDYAATLPKIGDAKTYLLKLAKESPGSLGLSAMFEFELEPVVNGYGEVAGMVARLSSLEGIDLVGKPAANPRGLLSALPAPMTPTSGWQDANPQPPATAPLPIDTPEDSICRGMDDDALDLLATVCSAAHRPDADALEVDDDNADEIQGTMARCSDEQRMLLKRAAANDPAVSVAATKEQGRRQTAAGCAEAARRAILAMDDDQVDVAAAAALAYVRGDMEISDDAATHLQSVKATMTRKQSAVLGAIGAGAKSLAALAVGEARRRGMKVLA